MPTPIENLLPAEQAIQKIIENLDRYTKEALKPMDREQLKSPSAHARVVELLHKRIVDELATVNVTLDVIMKSPMLKTLFQKSGRLSAVLNHHEQLLTNKHFERDRPDNSLMKVVKKIFNSRDTLWNQAQTSSVEKTMLLFVSLVQQEFEKSNHSLNELFEPNNKPQLVAYCASIRLKLAL